MSQRSLKAIRAFCLHCVGDSSREVERCTAGKPNLTGFTCTLYPFRFGRDPYKPKRKLTPEQLAACSQRITAATVARIDKNRLSGARTDVSAD